MTRSTAGLVSFSVCMYIYVYERVFQSSLVSPPTVTVKAPGLTQGTAHLSLAQKPLPCLATKHTAAHSVTKRTHQDSDAAWLGRLGQEWFWELKCRLIGCQNKCTHTHLQTRIQTHTHIERTYNINMMICERNYITVSPPTTPTTKTTNLRCPDISSSTTQIGELSRV